MKKPQIRERLRNIRKQATGLEKMKVEDNVLKYLGEGKGQVVALYFSRDGEVPVHTLREALEEKGWKVALPKVVEKNAPLAFYVWDGSFDSEGDLYHIPCATGERVTPEIIVLPLVAFDENLNRLGMGGGYFDRTLALKQHKKAIGVAYEAQRVEKIPTETHDEALDVLITELNILERT